jgi:urea transport system permease protein
VFLNWQELPWFWFGFDQFWFAMIMVLLAPGLLAFVFGWFAFKSRVTGVYLSIITQAMTYALLLAFFRNEMGFGGNNGLTDFKELLGFSLQSDNVRVGLFIASAIALALGYLSCRYIVNSKLGRVSVAIRDSEDRVRFMGYRVDYFKLWVFTFSAVLAGIAGALYVPQVGIINPSEFSPINSIEIVVWVAVGGRATLFGAVLGALVVNYAKTYFTGAFPEIWLFGLGALFILVTIFAPKGIIGALRKLKKPAQSAVNQTLEVEAK